MIAKRLFDVLVSGVAIVLLMPAFGLIALAVKLGSHGPAIFAQERVGLGGRPFNIFKFRSMVTDAPSMGPEITAKDDPRVTRFGRLLRATKLDELPQLWNVLVGDMSLVGPRPEVLRYVDRYPEGIRHQILAVRPGITDPASIAFRDEEAMLARASDREKAYVEDILPRKLELCAAYVSNRSFAGDLAILLRTLLVLVR